MKRTWLRVLVLTLVVALLLPAVIACGKPADTTENPDDPKDPAVGYVDDGKTYSYRMAPSILPDNWNYHTYTANEATYVLSYTGSSLYTFDYNDDFTGFEIVPAMAVDFPTDVTADYIGKYGLVEGDTGRAWAIELKTNLKFDNGEPITAQSFVDSMKLLLNPKAANSRAVDVYESGTLKIVGAEAYVKGGSYALGQFVSAAYGDDEYVHPNNFTTTADGYLQVNGQDIILDLNDGGNWGDALSLYAQYGYLAGVQASYDALAAAADEKGQVKLTAATLKNLQDCIAALHGHANVEAYAAAAGDYAYKEFEEMAKLGKTWAAIDYEGNVGFFVDAEGRLVIVSTTEQKDGFYFRKDLCTNFFLVYAPLYESLITDSQGVYANTYGTSVDTFVGYGPYKLVSYTEGAEIILERNPHWYGYTAEDYVEGSYMTDRVVYNVVTEDATRREMFLKGELESYSLREEDMADYLGSDYTYFTDSESTWYMVMNPDMSHLTEVQGTVEPKTPGNAVIKTVLTIAEFRQALSYAIDREQFNLTLSPTSGVAKALLSAFIVADPESGMTYRAMDEAKDAILNFWGLADQWGEGKEYATRDEAIDSITGYDPAGAKELFKAAYDKAVEQNLIPADAVASGKWEVQIIIGKPAEAGYYNKGYEFFKLAWENAVKDTPFEGKLQVIQSEMLGNGWGDALRNGNVDVLFGVGFGGDEFDPYTMIDCFVRDDLAYDAFTDKKSVMVDIEIGGKTLRTDLYTWIKGTLGEKLEPSVVGADGNVTSEKVTVDAGPNAEDKSVRVKILAATETAIMNMANCFPLQTDASASMRCMRLNYKTEDYVTGMGFGSIKYYTYSMDDAEFAAYVAEQGGVLNYK